eukprot:TRINITY_DN4833_c0_g1_i2.p1 TRINITY_DN4833_c0_g1~~TRINITY_DN4833_c0_g1_i2.p1  ORF type:complete len:429 (+),score=152.24 TRINITY_DN4833_c0_g1_i2:2-1288(+)
MTNAWASLGYRAAMPAAGMQGLDTVVFDADSTRVVDFDIASGNSQPTAESGAGSANLVSHEASTGTIVTFTRLLDTGSATDFKLEMGSAVRFAVATGKGSASAMEVHTSKNMIELQLEKCVLPTPTPKAPETPAPSAATVTGTPAMQGTSLFFAPCLVGTVMSQEEVTAAGNVRVTQQVGTIGVSEAAARESTQDALMLTVEVQVGQGERWAAVGIRPTSLGKSGMDGLTMYAADTSVPGVFASSTATGNGAPQLAPRQLHHFYSSDVTNGVLKFKFFRDLKSQDSVGSYDMTVERDWELAWALGGGSAFSTWSGHGSGDAGILTNAFRLSRCDASVAATKDKETDDGGIGIGVIIAIILGVLVLCGLIAAAVYFFMFSGKESVEYGEFVEKLNSDQDFNNEFEEAMKEHERETRGAESSDNLAEQKI